MHPILPQNFIKTERKLCRKFSLDNSAFVTVLFENGYQEFNAVLSTSFDAKDHDWMDGSLLSGQLLFVTRKTDELLSSSDEINGK